MLKYGRTWFNLFTNPFLCFTSLFFFQPDICLRSTSRSPPIGQALKVNSQTNMASICHPLRWSRSLHNGRNGKIHISFFRLGAGDCSQRPNQYEQINALTAYLSWSSALVKDGRVHTLVDRSWRLKNGKEKKLKISCRGFGKYIRSLDEYLLSTFQISPRRAWIQTYVDQDPRFDLLTKI